MIAVDTNILVYAHRLESPFHHRAAIAITRLAEGTQSWGIPWHCLYEFYSAVTHPRVHKPPTPSHVALAQVDIWLESPSVSLLAESGQHWPALRALLASSRIVGPAVYDARIASLCLEHGVKEFWTADRDFSRYPDLNPVNPLVISEDRLP